MITRPVSKRIVPVLAALLFGACAKGEQSGDTAAAAAGNPPAAAQAQSGGSGAITADDIRNYRLTMDRVRAFHQGQVAWSKDAAAKAEAKAHENDKDESSSAEPTAAESATWLMRGLEKRPATLAAIEKSGFTAREAAIHTMVLTYASLAAVSGAPSAEVSAENVEFVRKNRAEIERMQKEASGTK